MTPPYSRSIFLIKRSRNSVCELVEGIEFLINGKPINIGSYFRTMAKKPQNLLVSYVGSHSADHKNETALSIFGELTGLLAASDKQGLSCLSYLLRMAQLEAQTIATEDRDVPNLHPANRNNHH